ncbi:MAG: [FeFe] hydrogenase H-cluster maturation GTPase HydF [bacterium]|nr:[FeFe] hydrogenase H-cluster maturation GTPase HydF [bacterium]
MKATPRGLRLHIGIFGRRNVGKSSLLNALTRQQVAIVSEVAGTTTDPVEKPMEMLPLGPVVFIDTAGIDDEGALGSLRVEKTRRILDRTDLALVVAAGDAWGRFEEDLLGEFTRRQVPVIVVWNKADLSGPPPVVVETLSRLGIPCVATAAAGGDGIAALRGALIAAAPDDWINPPSILGGLAERWEPGAPVVLVIPIDQEAPKGRIILPQVQVIRDLLDHERWCVVVKENALADALATLRRPPALVVTDSQAFAEVSALVPPDVPLTGFSVLMSRWKGDLAELARGAVAIDTLRPGDRVLIIDACTHHPITDDIAREKLPRWLNAHVGGELAITNSQGRDWPADLASYKLVVHCGACMWNRREMLSRILHAREAGVPITNFGMAIAWSLGVFARALAPFPELAGVELGIARRN